MADADTMTNNTASEKQGLLDEKVDKWQVEHLRLLLQSFRESSTSKAEVSKSEPLHLLDRRRVDSAATLKTALAAKASSKTKHVALERFDLTLDMAMTVVEFLITSNITRLELLSCRGQPESFMAIFLALDCVECLSLANNNNLCFESWCALGISLKNFTLKELSIIANPLSEDDMNGLVDGLKDTTTLHTLSLQNCRFLAHHLFWHSPVD